ncbi:transposase, IS4 family [Streptosporangium subroseum]|uniref:Transposase, IS4 family n=1 Tax=Streptosporangium subroseum TaxID=106412 RepID=A0A239APH8_9ACTN|nr:IS4 family transposase [Streptosporangium subroseum]SNR96954.1 transposase, IS4 family [Streptosporangium subroseum]
MAEWIKTGGPSRLTDLVALGALTSLLPRAVLDGAIEKYERREQRVRKLPAHVVVYLLIALCLFPDDDYEEVAEKLTGMLALMPGSRWEPPTRGAVTQARQRLGAEPVKEVFECVARPAASPTTEGAWLGRWRLMAIDGFVLDLPDTPANLEEFPKDSAGGYETVFAQARVVAISECASHAIVAADVSGCWDGEQTLAYSLYERLEEDMLLLADRDFYSFYAWGQARRTGAQLLWRVQAGLRPYWLRDLDDGSWLAVITNPVVGLHRSQKDRLREDARQGRSLDPDRAVIVRVVDYTVPDRKGDHIRLITTILDPAEVTAGRLASCYHQRWEAETGFDQLKTHLRGPGRILRSRTPDLARQEIWAYLLTHWALATLICVAATTEGVDPDRIKFLATLRIVRRSVTDRAAFPP